MNIYFIFPFPLPVFPIRPSISIIRPPTPTLCGGMCMWGEWIVLFAILISATRCRQRTPLPSSPIYSERLPVNFCSMKTRTSSGLVSPLPRTTAALPPESTWEIDPRLQARLLPSIHSRSSREMRINRPFVPLTGGATACNIITGVVLLFLTYGTLRLKLAKCGQFYCCSCPLTCEFVDIMI